MRRSVLAALVAVAMVVMTSRGWAQDPTGQSASSDRGPRFLMVTARETVLLDVSRTPALRRRVSIDMRHTPLRMALDTIARQAGLSLSFSPDIVNLEMPVTLEAKNLTVAAALTEVLIDMHLDVVLSPSGQLSLVRQPAPPAVGIVTGRVTDSTVNEGIPGVRVSVEGTRLVVTTGLDGNYAIHGVIAGSQTITARKLGYRTRSRTATVADNGTANVDFALVQTPTSLTDVVVTPTGDRQRLEVGNAIGTIKADSLVPLILIRNMSDLLTARTPGVIVSSSAGTVGAPSKVRIRGINSVRLNNDPIIILDGVRLLSQITVGESQINTGGKAVAVAAGSLGVTGAPSGIGANFIQPLSPSRLDDIDPNSVESIDVLRGPSAASLYGTEAANGVIVIKTKKGTSGPMSVSLTGDVGRSFIPGQLPPTWFGWGHLPNGRPTVNCRLTDGSGGVPNVADGSCVQDSVTAFNYQNDPQMRTLGSGTNRTFGASLSGGTQQLQEFLSLRVFDNIGIPRMSKVEERRIRRSGNAPPPWMLRPNSESGVSGSSRTSIHMGSTLDLSLTAGGIYRDVLNNPWAGAQAQLGNGFQIAALSDTLSFVSAEGSRARIGNITKRGYASASGNYSPRSWLSLRATLGGDYTLRTDESLVRASECVFLGAACQTAHSNARGETFVTTMDIGAQFTFAPLEWIHSRTSIGEQYNKTRYSSLFAGNPQGTNLAFGTDLLSPPPLPTFNSQLYQVTEERDEGATAGWYLEQTIGLRERLFLTAGIRQDVASAFGQSVNNNAPVYPKLGISWLVSQEPFFPSQALVSSFRLRAAYGHSGQQAGQGDVLHNFQLSNTWINGTKLPGIVLSQVGNPGLKPERTVEWEGGADVSFLANERVRIEGTLYRKLSEDAIFSTALPGSYGIGDRYRNWNLEQRQNIGSVENRGAELSLTARLIDSHAFGWDFTVNAAKNANKLVKRSASAVLSARQFRVGYPIFGHFGQRILSYSDVNGDGILAFSEAVFSDTTLLGAPYPSSELSYVNSFSFLSGALRINANLDQVNGVTTQYLAPTRAFFDRTTPLAEQAAALEAQTGSGGFRNPSSSLRLAELSMTYSLSGSIAGKLLHTRTASITLAGRNLGLWTNYVGKDPNIDSSLGACTTCGSAKTEQTQDRGTVNVVPQPRLWTIRLNLGL